MGGEAVQRSEHLFCCYKLELKMVNLNEAIEAFNELVELNVSKGVATEETVHLHTIGKYIEYQQLRAQREKAGTGYMNREDDVVNNLRSLGL